MGGWVGGWVRRALLAFLSDHHVILVVAVVGVSEPPVWPELKLHEFVPKLALVAAIISNVELLSDRRAGESQRSTKNDRA